jgi:predicted nuclease of predicted toxin-antitoxin system
LKLLADENVHPLVVRTLRDGGHDVEWVKETSRGASDADILMRPDIGEMALVTLDRDFGDLIFKRGFPAPRAILYSRLSRARPQAIAERIAAILERGPAERHMTTINARGERTKPFPGVQDVRD